VLYGAIREFFKDKSEYNKTIHDAAIYMSNKLKMMDRSKLSNDDMDVTTDLQAAVKFMSDLPEGNKQKRRRMYPGSRADMYELTLRVSQIMEVASGLPVSLGCREAVGSW
jgi:hypothetical protein